MAHNEMGSPQGPDDEQWKRLIKVHNVPPGMTPEDAEELFENEAIGGPVEMVYMMPISTAAEITFENEADAIKVASHRTVDFKGEKLLVNRVNPACDSIMSTSSSHSLIRHDDDDDDDDAGSMSSSIVVLNDAHEFDRDSITKKIDVNIQRDAAVDKKKQNQLEGVPSDSTDVSQGDSRQAVLKLGLQLSVLKLEAENQKVKEWLDTSDSEALESEELELKNRLDIFEEREDGGTTQESLDVQTEVKTDSRGYISEGGPDDKERTFHSTNELSGSDFHEDSQTISKVMSNVTEERHFNIKEHDVEFMSHNTSSQNLETNSPWSSKSGEKSSQNKNIHDNVNQRAVEEECAKLHRIECSVRIHVVGGCEDMKIDTLERYVKKHGGEIADCKKINSETFEIQFKAREDALKFLSCEHVLEGKTLIVQEIPSSEFVRGDAPMEDLEPQKILVKWTEGSKLTRDSLMYYLEDVTGSKELKIDVPKPKTAIVELDTPWDAETLRRRFKVINLFDDGSVNLTATPLKKATCIALQGFSTDKSLRHSLQFYFDNPNKGGHACCKVDLSGDMPLVNCPNSIVASRLASVTHTFDGKEYSAVTVYEDIGIPSLDFNKNHPYLEPPSAVEVDCKEELLEFITDEKNLSYVNLNLGSVYAVIDSSLKPQRGRMWINCLLRKEMPDYQSLCLSWETKVKEMVANISSSLGVERFRSTDETWAPLKQKIVSLNDDMPVSLLQMDDMNKEIKLIALSDDMTILKERIEKMIQDVTKDVKSKDHDEKYKPLHLKFLQKNGELDKVSNLTEVQIRPGAQDNSLRFTGIGDNLLKATQALNNTVENLHEANIDVSQNLARLLETSSSVQKAVDKVLKSSVFHVAGEKVTLCGKKHDVEEATVAFKESITDYKVFFQSESKSLIGNEYWLEMQDILEKKIGQNKFRFDVNMAELRIELASLTKDAKTLKESFISFFETHTVLKEQVELPEGKLHIVCSEFDKDMKAIQEKMNSERVSVEITSFGKKKSLVIQGNKKECRQMREDIDALISKIHTHKETVTGVGAKALGQEMAKHFRLSVEHDCKVHVEILNSDSSNSSYESTENDISVKVLVGSIEECPADVLVNPANEDLKHGGGLAKVLADAGGPIVNSESLVSVELFGKVKVGEVRITRGGMLPCKVLYHTVGPKYNKEQSNTSFESQLYHTTTACLDQVAKDGYQSIALPLISAGAYGGPIKVVTRCMGRAIADFVNGCAGANLLKEIIVIDYDQRKTEELESVLQGHFGGAIAKTPQRPIAASDTNEVTKQPEQKEQSEQSDQKESKQSERKDNRIILCVDKIKQIKVDVIVNSMPRNCNLLQGPLSKSIMDCFGKKDQKVIQDQVKSQAPIGEFDFATTDGGGLWRAIYHCRLGKWDGGKGAATMGLTNLIKKILKTASASEFESIAIPAIGTGYMGFPHDVVASTIHKTASQHMDENPSGSLQKVELIAKDDESVRAFKNVLSGNHNGQPGSDAVIKGKVMIEEIRFEVLEADITKETTDCIVNGTNQRLDLAQGKVSQAILSAAGNSVVEDCKKQGKVQKNGTYMSGAGNLKCRKICHLNVGHDNDNFKENIKTCLQEAENFHLKSISFPALGTGQYQKDPGQMARLTMEAIAEFTKTKPNHVKEIRVCIFDKPLLDIYQAEMQRVAVEGLKPSLRKKIKGKLFGKSKQSGDGKASISFSSVPEEKKVELCITYTQSQNRDKAIEMIKEFCRKQEKTTVIGGLNEKEYCELIKTLNSFKEHNIETEAKRLGVEIGIDKGTGMITLKGHENDVTEVILKVKEILLAVKNQLDEDQKAKMVADFVQWQFRHGDKFEAYPQDINLDIENAYKNNKSCVSWLEDLDGEARKVTVNFERMVEEDEQENQIKVLRLATDLKCELPKNWTPMSDTDRFKLVQLSSSDTEYKEVEKEFRSTVPNLKIVKIQRIQNKGLYQRYLVHKQQMELNGNANEKLLWHGTGPDVVKNIIANGFNRSYCGVHGTTYGRGVYFAPYTIRHLCQPIISQYFTAIKPIFFVVQLSSHGRIISEAVKNHSNK